MKRRICQVSKSGKLLPALLLFCFTLFLFSVIFVATGRAYDLVAVGKEYYFLVREVEVGSSVAVAEQVFGSGGAGVEAEFSGRCVVVYATYYSSESARSVCEGLGDERCYVVRSPRPLVKRDNLERAQGAADTLDGVSRVLYALVVGFGEGEMTQDSAKLALKDCALMFDGLRTLGDGSWEERINGLKRESEELSEGIIFSRSVRKLQTSVCLLITQLSSFFG